MTRDKLGSDAGVAVSTISKLESGRVSEPGLFTVWAICKALHFEVSELFRDLEYNDDASGGDRLDTSPRSTPPEPEA
jgi:transcriptional regulator with XRE-family HTH domain